MGIHIVAISSSMCMAKSVDLGDYIRKLLLPALAGSGIGLVCSVYYPVLTLRRHFTGFPVGNLRVGSNFTRLKFIHRRMVNRFRIGNASLPPTSASSSTVTRSPTRLAAEKEQLTKLLQLRPCSCIYVM